MLPAAGNSSKSFDSTHITLLAGTASAVPVFVSKNPDSLAQLPPSGMGNDCLIHDPHAIIHINEVDLSLLIQDHH